MTKDTTSLSPNAAEFQYRLFQHIIARCENQSVIPQLCELLCLNKSSVYNRLKGDKMLDARELLLLAKTYEFSIDQHLFQSRGFTRFHFENLALPVRSCREYLEQILNSFKTFASVPELKVWFSVSALPFFHHLNFRELGLFKIFAYARLNWQLPYTENLVFHPDTFPENRVCEQLMRPVLEAYCKLDTIEFWPDELYQTTLKQIRYFTECGQIADKSLAQILADQLAALCEHQYRMAREGRKWPLDEKPETNNGNFELYHNEVAPLNITLLAESPSLKGIFTVYDDPNFMFSDDPDLYRYTLDWMRKLSVKCLKISKDSDQLRRAYFNGLREQIRLKITV